MKPSASAASAADGEHVADVAEPVLAGDLGRGAVVAVRRRAGRAPSRRHCAACRWHTLKAPGTGSRRVQREHVGAGDVAHVDEVAQLAAVLEHARRVGPRPARSAKIAATPAYGVSRGIRGP